MVTSLFTFLSILLYDETFDVFLDVGRDMSTQLSNNNGLPGRFIIFSRSLCILTVAGRKHCALGCTSYRATPCLVCAWVLVGGWCCYELSVWTQILETVPSSLFIQKQGQYGQGAEEQQSSRRYEASGLNHPLFFFISVW